MGGTCQAEGTTMQETMKNNTGYNRLPGINSNVTNDPHGQCYFKKCLPGRAAAEYRNMGCLSVLP